VRTRARRDRIPAGPMSESAVPTRETPARALRPRGASDPARLVETATPLDPIPGGRNGSGALPPPQAAAVGLRAMALAPADPTSGGDRSATGRRDRRRASSAAVGTGMRSPGSAARRTGATGTGRGSAPTPRLEAGIELDRGGRVTSRTAVRRTVRRRPPASTDPRASDAPGAAARISLSNPVTERGLAPAGRHAEGIGSAARAASHPGPMTGSPLHTARSGTGWVVVRRPCPTAGAGHGAAERGGAETGPIVRRRDQARNERRPGGNGRKDREHRRRGSPASWSARAKECSSSRIADSAS
jgi:hypothetical protein